MKTLSNTSYCSTKLTIIFTTCSKYCILPALAASCIGLGCAVLCWPALCLVALASLKSAHKGSGGFLCLAALGYPALLGWTWLRWLYPRKHIDQNRGSLGEAHRIKHWFAFLARGSCLFVLQLQNIHTMSTTFFHYRRLLYNASNSRTPLVRHTSAPSMTSTFSVNQSRGYGPSFRNTL